MFCGVHLQGLVGDEVEEAPDLDIARWEGCRGGRFSTCSRNTSAKVGVLKVPYLRQRHLAPFATVDDVVHRHNSLLDLPPIGVVTTGL